MTGIGSRNTRRLVRAGGAAVLTGSAWAISCVRADGVDALDQDAEGVEVEQARVGMGDDAYDLLSMKREDPEYDASLNTWLQPEIICMPEDGLQAVNVYAGDLGVSIDYVQEHKRPVGAMATVPNVNPNSPPGGWKFCSGTLVATNVFLTASHCVDSQTVGRVVAMNYELSQEENSALLEEKRYRINAVLVDDDQWDFALLRLDGDPGGEFGWTDIREESAIEGEAIAIIQHPKGEPKQLHAGHVAELDLQRLYYADVNTHQGSSGAGVLDAAGRLVGIHTMGGCVPITGGPQPGRNMGLQMAYALSVSNELLEISRGTHWQSAMGWCVGEGVRLLVGDLDGDGRDDMLCHDQAGNKWVTLADSSGQFTQDTWFSPMGWCVGEAAQLFLGDFDGNGRKDMLCHESAGTDSVALADEFGRFSATAWSAPTSWCSGEGARLFVGDFNGDRRDDTLCHGPQGSTAISFADPSGAFSGEDWSAPLDWCRHEGAQLFVGDFNGDGRDDLLCHDPAGDKRVALADPSGHFSGESWHSPMAWCHHAGAQLFIGDFNGDGRDDMLCHDQAGSKWVALADESGQFPQNSWNVEMGWCAHAELHVGKFNQDARSDMLCHDKSGYKWISNAREDGSF
ncbi:FG-GAP-like repeat-containing protein [Nannocystis pusilla]|uniref:FG-GAP-like repeat-containing protein n=1 Tax=Nannocystis pusilla TaxID=889268 RepID=UPI003DA6CAFD